MRGGIGLFPLVPIEHNEIEVPRPTAWEPVRPRVKLIQTEGAHILGV
jgi:hypothetical protein